MLDYLSVPYPIRRLRAYLWSRRPPRGQLEAASRWAARELRRAIRRMDAAGWREQPGLTGIRHDALREGRRLRCGSGPGFAEPEARVEAGDGDIGEEVAELHRQGREEDDAHVSVDHLTYVNENESRLSSPSTPAV